MNSLINFYTCSKEFRANEAKKLKKRNTELYGEYAFIEGYCEKESKVYA